MPYHKIIDQKIQHPVQNHIRSAGEAVTEQLLRYPFPERTVEEINDLRDYVC